MGDLIQLPSLEQRLPPDDPVEKEVEVDSKYELMVGAGYGVMGVTFAGFFIKGMIDVIGTEAPIYETAQYMLMAAPLPLNAAIGRYAGKLFASGENVRRRTVSEKECKNLGTLIGTLLTGIAAGAGYGVGAVMTYGVKAFR